MEDQIIHDRGKKNLLQYIDTGVWLALTFVSTLFLVQFVVALFGTSAQVGDVLFITPGTVALGVMLFVVFVVTTLLKKAFGLFDYLSDATRVLYVIIGGAATINVLVILFSLLYLGIRGELSLVATATLLVILSVSACIVARLVGVLFTRSSYQLTSMLRVGAILCFAGVLVLSFFQNPNQVVAIERDVDRINEMDYIVNYIESFGYYGPDNGYDQVQATQENVVVTDLQQLLDGGYAWDDELTVPKSGERYEYILGTVVTDGVTSEVSEYSYQLCAEFEHGDVSSASEWDLPYEFDVSEWPIAAGRSCIDRTVVIGDYYTYDDDWYSDDYYDYDDDWYSDDYYDGGSFGY